MQRVILRGLVLLFGWPASVPCKLLMIKMYAPMLAAHIESAGHRLESRYKRASSSNDGCGIPSFQVGSRNSSRLPVGSKK
jgi:hypothetical protein